MSPVLKTSSKSGRFRQVCNGPINSGEVWQREFSISALVRSQWRLDFVSLLTNCEEEDDEGAVDFFFTRNRDDDGLDIHRRNGVISGKLAPTSRPRLMLVSVR